MAFLCHLCTSILHWVQLEEHLKSTYIAKYTRSEESLPYVKKGNINLTEVYSASPENECFIEGLHVTSHCRLFFTAGTQVPFGALVYVPIRMKSSMC